MVWFLQWLFRLRQALTIQDSSVTGTVQQAGRDALSFQNVEQVTITYKGLFGSRQATTGIDWEWAGRVIKEQQAEVRNRLRYVLRDRAPMSVQMSEQPERVNLPALESARRLTIAGQDSELLDPGKLMIEVFGQDDIAGKLLILGTPGAGKTTVLLSLAEQLLVGAIDNSKTAIPIIFELSTWKNDNQSIHDWLIEQLYDLYGGDRKQKRYEQWLDQRVLLPLLDGLDELGMERQKKCMAKLNEFTRHYPQVVVCCRSKEFEESGIRLGSLRSAVELQPLSDRQIQTYLHQVDRTGLWAQIQETPEMQQMLKPNEDGEAGLLRVPLFVAIAASIYDVNQPFRTKWELLERYIERQLSFDVRMSDRRKELEKREWAYTTVEKEPRVEATRRYLTWLARRLDEINEVDFLIEEMQPIWIERIRAQYSYYSMVVICTGSIFGLIAGLLGELTVSLNFGLIFALVSGLVFGLLLGLHNKIELIESFQILILLQAKQEILNDLREWLILGLIFSITFGLVAGLNTGLIPSLFFGLFCVVFCMLMGLKRHNLQMQLRLHPNQGIWNSFYNTLLTVALLQLIAILGLSSVAIGSNIQKQVEANLISLVARNASQFLLSSVLIASLNGLLYGGGLTCIQHICLRFVLWQSGIIPWNYARFLNYCTERRLLQRIGGRYRFIHRELLEHFVKQGDFGF